MELTREHFRAIIFYNFRRGLSRQECIDELKSLFGDKAPSYSTVKNWFDDFSCGRRSPAYIQYCMHNWPQKRFVLVGSRII